MLGGHADRVALGCHALAQVPHGALHLVQVLPARRGLLVVLGEVASQIGNVEEVVRVVLKRIRISKVPPNCIKRSVYRVGQDIRPET